MQLKFSYRSQRIVIYFLWPLLKYLSSNYCKHNFNSCHKQAVFFLRKVHLRNFIPSMCKKKRRNFLPPVKAVKSSHFLLR